jgi:hypothetical protein
MYAVTIYNKYTPLLTCLFVALSSETSQFLFRFDMSTLIENAMTKVFLFRGENCDIDIWDNNVSHKSSRVLLVSQW